MDKITIEGVDFNAVKVGEHKEGDTVVGHYATFSDDPNEPVKWRQAPIGAEKKKPAK